MIPSNHRPSATALNGLLELNEVEQIGGGFARRLREAGADAKSGVPVRRKCGGRQR